MKIYLASPLGFSEVGRDFYYSKIVPTLKRLGYEILDPWQTTDRKKLQRVSKMTYGLKKKSAWQTLNSEICQNNISAIQKSQGIFAVLDGVDVDSGTASEIGFAFALGKPILGYRGDFRLSSDNEGGIVNLQVEGFIRKSGGDIITEIAQLPSHALRVFGSP